jgi:Post-segregation antitoxin CcdA
MPKLNIYVDEDLAQRIKNSGIEMSRVCRDALWAAIEKEQRAVCKKCKAPATYYVRKENAAPVYVCDDHVVGYLGDQSVVRAL